ncbi:MAG: restriction endonuclease [Sulfuriferula sp.]|nr:restriction endonuclease [Sulfuriferula sp.]
MRNLCLDQTEISHFTSKSQKIRVMSESWTPTEIVCAACGSQLQRSVANSKVLDFRCVNCTAEYELKSKSGKFTKKVTDGGYSAMMTRLAESNSPHFFFMSYDMARLYSERFFPGT